jgi:hypothetical protein
LYDPTAGTFRFTNVNMQAQRVGHTAMLLTNGQVLLAGGTNSCAQSCNSVLSTELYNPVSDTFAASQNLAAARSSHSGTLVFDGRIFFVGGVSNGTTLASVDSYTPSTLTPPSLVSIAVVPANPSVLMGKAHQIKAVGTFSSGPTQTLQSVVWTSSNAAVSEITNAAGSGGFVSPQGVGTTTITATAGNVSGSTTLTVPELVSLTLSPINPVITVGTSQQFTASGTFSDGTTHDQTSAVTWDSSDLNVLAISNSAGSQGLATAIGAGTASVTATLGEITANTLVTTAHVQNTGPTITGVSPSSGAPKIQVLISGSGFGATKGSGTVWLGSTYGFVRSWSDTEITAEVVPGSTSGVVQVQQGGVWSNWIDFAISTPIVSRVTPTSGIPGTQVTVTGSGFGASQGTGNVVLGTVYGNVVSWSDTQVVATVAAGSTTGTARIFQSGTVSNAVNFTVNSPHIDGVDPHAGAPGTSVTITGTGFGNSQGNGYVWLGNQYGIVSSWNSTEIVCIVAGSAQSGTARVFQNGIWSNAINFTVLGSGKTSADVTLEPNLISMLVGETRTLQALDANGSVIHGLTWNSSDPNVAALSADDPPVITALAEGNATITAGDGSATIVVYAGSTLPPGTVIWSNPAAASGIVPAVPSSEGVADVFALGAGAGVVAITSEGTTKWTSSINGSAVPDFQGGLIDAGPQSISKLDGITGQRYPAYTAGSDVQLSQVAVHTDGTIFTIRREHNPDRVFVVGIDPKTGNEKFSIEPPHSRGYTMNENYFPCGPVVDGGPATVVAGPIVAGDGFAYVAYTYSLSSSSCNNVHLVLGLGLTGPPCDTYTWVGAISTTAERHLELLRVGSGGDHSTISVKRWDQNWSWYHDASCSGSTGGSTADGILPSLYVNNPITDTDQGALLSWQEHSDPYWQNISSTWPGPTQYSGYVDSSNKFYIRSTRPGSDERQLDIAGQSGPVQPVLQAQDNSFIGTVSTDAGNLMVNFDSSASTKWQVAGDYQPKIATADGGLIVASDTGSAMTFDQNGNITGQIPMPIQSWRGNSYEFGSVDQKALDLPLPATPNFWSFDQANQSQNRTSGICHDSRDQLMAEYPKYNAGFVPVCSDFMPSSVSQPTTHFSFAELNTSDIQRNEYPNWAILKPRLLSGLEDWRADYGQPLTINSGYRSPLVQNIINSSAPKDRHIHGDAADVQAGTDAVWSDLHDSALAVGGCVEPKSLSGVGHVHTDWRQDEWRGVCPALWKQ